MSHDYLTPTYQPPNRNQTNPQPQHNYNDYGITSQMSQTKKSQGQSDLVIFNGQQSDRQMYRSSQKIQGFGHQGALLQKSVSQKKMPIIYQSKEESGQRYGGGVRGERGRQQENPVQGNSSEVYQYGHMFPKTAKDNGVDSNGFQTFKYIPPENNPQTAHFIPAQTSQVQERRPRQVQVRQRDHVQQRGQHLNHLNLPGQEERQHHHQQMPQPPHQHSYQPFHQMESSHRPQSNVITPLGRPSSSQAPPMQAPISPRNIYQPPRHQPPHPQQNPGPNMIKIPQDEYQKFIDHLPLCKQTQDQIRHLKQKNSQTSQKQHFYWQQNMTLREQNKRLRDLVTHFEKRDNQLKQSRDDFRNAYEHLIVHYKESALQEFTLLFERYRLEMQKGS